MLKSILIKAALLVLFGVSILTNISAFTPSSGEAQAASCKSNVVSRQIKARYKSLGKQRARANWRKKARKKYGWKYRKWEKAKPKGYQIEVRGQYYLLYRIRAYGTPCK